MERVPPLLIWSCFKITFIYQIQKQKMKTKLLKIIFIIFSFGLFVTACGKDEMQFDDESIQVSSYPGFCIYKTKNNYINNIEVGIDSTGNVSWTTIYSFSSNAVSVDKGIVSLKNRYLLKSGYILDFTGFNVAFTDITIKEMCEKYQEFGSDYWSGKMQSRIIDKNPYTEYYQIGSLKMPERIFTLGEINKMIESGTLEPVFTKLK